MLSKLQRGFSQALVAELLLDYHHYLLLKTTKPIAEHAGRADPRIIFFVHFQLRGIFLYHSTALLYRLLILHEPYGCYSNKC